jgi:hypothetical protein
LTRRIQLILNSRRFFVAALLVLALGTLFAGLQAASAQTTSSIASLRIQAANIVVNAGFNAVFAAEKTGANVTSLLAQLNNAALLLSQAEIANRTGDYDTAVARADSVLLVAQPVTSAAQVAQRAAETSTQDAFWITIVFTAIDAVVFVAILFLGWRWLKARYMKNVLESKPEVPGQ